MSITIITGVPGSGKTLYAVSKLLPQIIGTTVDKVLDDGSIQKLPRTVYTNINGLLLDHVLIETGGAWSMAAGRWSYDGNAFGARNWHQWAEPGSLICFDEFQRAWPPRPNGAHVPPDVSALDTHRHMGVDFILICQNLMNVDRHILGLCDRHLHVRRMANTRLSIVYEWDHASKTLAYKNAMNKGPWRYDASAFKLYKSAEVHTKQKRKIPGVVWGLCAALLGGVFLWPTFVGRINDRVHSVPISAANASPVPHHAFGSGDGAVKTSTEPFPPSPAAMASVPAVVASAPSYAGCIIVASRCGCFDNAGHAATVEPSLCLEVAGAFRGSPVPLTPDPPPVRVASSLPTFR